MIYGDVINIHNELCYITNMRADRAYFQSEAFTHDFGIQLDLVFVSYSWVNWEQEWCWQIHFVASQSGKQIASEWFEGFMYAVRDEHNDWLVYTKSLPFTPAGMAQPYDVDKSLLDLIQYVKGEIAKSPNALLIRNLNDLEDVQLRLNAYHG